MKRILTLLTWQGYCVEILKKNCPFNAPDGKQKKNIFLGNRLELARIPF
jgi:hypothetical protein